MEKKNVIKLVAFAIVTALSVTLGLIEPFPGLEKTGMIFLGIFIWWVMMMIVELIPNALSCVLALVLSVAFGCGTTAEAFGSFSGATVWLLIGAIGLATALANSGLLNRLAINVMRLFPGTYAGQVWGLSLASVVCAPAVPSTTAKCTILIPLACMVGEKMGYDWEKSPLRVGLFGGEPCPPGLKAEIEERMHIVCTDNYGLTEVMGPGVSGECLASRDMQHIAEDHFLWEVVDPETGEPVGEGEMGELVLTPLDKQAIPVLRYRTHDLTRVVCEPCACGRTSARMQKVRARCDDMLIIRGTNVFPSQVEDVLSGIQGVTPHYRIVVETVNGLDRMTVHVELKPEAFSDSYQEMEDLRRSIEERLKGVLLVGVRVKLVEPGGIERTTGKAKHVEDLRK